MSATKRMLKEFDEMKMVRDIVEVEDALRALYIRTLSIVDGVAVNERDKLGKKMRLLIQEHGERIGVKGWMPGARNPRKASPQL